jgi:cytochrome c oxidase cbb3-type subunit 3
MARVRSGFGVGLLAGGLMALACAQLFGAKTPAAVGWHAEQGDAVKTEGKKIFESQCAACHGLDGHGGERGPDIATSAKTQNRSDDQLFRIVSHGIPGTGMPAFTSLSDENRKIVVSYLRLLQGKVAEEAKLAGDAGKGRNLFFGKAHCAECHSVAGSGGFIGEDLSTYGAMRSAEKIREAIVKPENGGVRMTVVTRQGQTYAGVLRNEDNFSLQIQTMEGAFHLFEKAKVQQITREPSPLMPYYTSTLSAAEMDDLVNFLVTTGRKAKPLLPPDKNAHDEGADDDE